MKLCVWQNVCYFLQHITLRGTVMLRIVRCLIRSVHSGDTAVQLYFPMGNTSSKGD